MTTDEIKTLLEQRLSPKRYAHSLGVADEAAKLAARWDYDKKKAYFMGLIHDITKNMSDQAHLKLCHDSGIMLDAVERRSPKLFHAKTGAYVAKCDLAVEDREILTAIAYHTTGRAGMSLPEKILYLADFIEPHRRFDGVETLRRLAYQDLDEAMLLALRMSVGYVLEDGNLLHLDTVQAMNDFIIICADKRQG